jgi:hypothetical protein
MQANSNGVASAPAAITITREQRDAIHYEIRNYALSEGPLGDFRRCIEHAGYGADAERYWAQITCAARVIEQIGWDKRGDRCTYTIAIDHELSEWVRWRLDETEGTLSEHAQAFDEVRAGGDPWWDRRGERRAQASIEVNVAELRDLADTDLAVVSACRAILDQFEVAR